jgi:hypothetical protein
MAKSNRRAEETLKNTPETVARITKYAFLENDEYVRIRLLTCLRGVAVPTASCILSWIFPERWGVIDQRAWRVLNRHKLVGDPKSGIGLRPDHWVQYNVVIQDLAKRSGQIPRHVDLWLFRYDGW